MPSSCMRNCRASCSIPLGLRLPSELWNQNEVEARGCTTVHHKSVHGTYATHLEFLPVRKDCQSRGCGRDSKHIHSAVHTIRSTNAEKARQIKTVCLVQNTGRDSSGPGNVSLPPPSCAKKVRKQKCRRRPTVRHRVRIDRRTFSIDG